MIIGGSGPVTCDACGEKCATRYVDPDGLVYCLDCMPIKGEKIEMSDPKQ